MDDCAAPHQRCVPVHMRMLQSLQREIAQAGILLTEVLIHHGAQPLHQTRR
jgi:hypothetical protein